MKKQELLNLAWDVLIHGYKKVEHGNTSLSCSIIPSGDIVNVCIGDYQVVFHKDDNAYVFKWDNNNIRNLE